jgi:hypothetical protein
MYFKIISENALPIDLPPPQNSIFLLDFYAGLHSISSVLYGLENMFKYLVLKKRKRIFFIQHFFERERV